jgi:hypothetical protein
MHEPLRRKAVFNPLKYFRDFTWIVYKSFHISKQIPLDLITYNSLLGFVEM